MQRRRFLVHSLAAATMALASAHSGAAAQASAHPLTVLVGFGAGGSADGLSRLVAEQMTQRLGRTFVVENRTGALGRIAIDAVANAPAGREVFLVAPFSSLLFSSLTVPTWKRDIHADLQPVANLTDYPLAIAVSPQIGVDSLPELLEWLKANPSRQVFGTAGTGGHNHLLGLAMGKAIDLPLQVIAYKGNAQLVTDVIGGHTPIGVGVAGDFLQHHENDRMKILAVFTPERSPLLPNIPTAKEQGLDLTSGAAWYAMWASPTMPKEQVTAVQQALSQSLSDEKFIEQIAERYSMTARYLDGAALDNRLREAGTYWQKVITETGFSPDQ